MNSRYKASILGLGAVSCYGDDVAALTDAVSQKQNPPLKELKTTYKGKNLDSKVYRVPKFKLLFDLPMAMERRLGQNSRFCFQAILKAMQEAEFEVQDANRVGIVIGTANGSSSLLEKFSRGITLNSIAHASPILFANSVHNNVASFVALSLGINGPSVTVVTKELTLAASIERACAWLAEDLVDYVLLAVGDEFFLKAHVANNYTYGPFQAETFNPLIEGNPIVGEGALGLVLGKTDNANCKQKISAVTHSPRSTFTPPERCIIDFKGGFEDHQKALEIARKTQVASYAKNYGSFTTGSAMDLAIASFGLRDAKLFASTSSHPEISTLKDTLDGIERIDLLQVSDQREIGHVELER